MVSRDFSKKKPPPPKTTGNRKQKLMIFLSSPALATVCMLQTYKRVYDALGNHWLGTKSGQIENFRKKEKKDKREAVKDKKYVTTGMSILARRTSASIIGG